MRTKEITPAKPRNAKARIKKLYELKFISLEEKKHLWESVSECFPGDQKPRKELGIFNKAGTYTWKLFAFNQMFPGFLYVHGYLDRFKALSRISKYRKQIELLESIKVPPEYNKPDDKSDFKIKPGLEKELSKIEKKINKGKVPKEERVPEIFREPKEDVSKNTQEVLSKSTKALDKESEIYKELSGFQKSENPIEAKNKTDEKEDVSKNTQEVVQISAQPNENKTREKTQPEVSQNSDEALNNKPRKTTHIRVLKSYTIKKYQNHCREKDGLDHTRITPLLMELYMNDEDVKQRIKQRYVEKY